MASKDYQAVRSEAQSKADAHGLYFRIWKNFFGEYVASGVPTPKNQYGSDLKGELIQPTTYRPEDWPGDRTVL